LIFSQTFNRLKVEAPTGIEPACTYWQSISGIDVCQPISKLFLKMDNLMMLRFTSTKAAYDKISPQDCLSENFDRPGVESENVAR